MQKAVFVTSYAYPKANEAPAIRLRSLMRSVAQHPNVKLSVYAPCAGEEFENPDELEERFDVMYVGEPRSLRRSFLIRGMQEVISTMRLIKAVRDSDAQVVVVSVPSVFLVLTPLLIRRRRVIVDVRDLVWEYLSASHGIVRIFGYIMRTIARVSLMRASAVTVTNSNQRATISKLVGKQPSIIANGIEKERFARLKQLELPNMHNERFHIAYIGNIGIAQNLDTLIEAARELNNIHITLVGAGRQLSHITDMVRTYRLNNVKLVGALPWQDAVDVLAKTHLVYGQIVDGFDSAVPSKFFEYAASGRPVIFAAPEGAMSDVIDEFQGVYRPPPKNKKALCEMVTYVKHRCSDKDWLQGVAQHNRSRIEQCYLREMAGDRFSEVFLKVLRAGD